jgi:hypothetical protein
MLSSADQLLALAFEDAVAKLAALADLARAPLGSGRTAAPVTTTMASLPSARR